MTDATTRRFWLSFADDSKPRGQQFLGVCVVEVTFEEAASLLPRIDREFPNHQEGAEWISAAVDKAWRLKCNPGGEVASLDITNAPNPDGIDVPLNRLMSLAELKQRGLVESNKQEAS